MQESTKSMPVWFVRAMALMLAKYPNSSANELTSVAYWDELGQYSQKQIAEAMRRACAESPTFAPSAFSVAEHAKAIKGPPIFRAETRPMLPEHDEREDPNGPNYQIWQAVKRGEKTQAEAVREIIERVSDGVTVRS